MNVVTVSVTQDDINAGSRYSEDCCPVARALRRVVPGKRVWVGPISVVCSNTEYELPPEAEWFIERFDLDFTCKPFEFELDMP